MNSNAVIETQMPVLGNFNERVIFIEEVRKAVDQMKSGLAPGLDRFPVKGLIKYSWYGRDRMVSKAVEHKF